MKVDYSGKIANNKIFPLLLSRTHVVGLLFVMGALYYSSIHSYLLFHSLVELFSILVFFSIFVIAWNVRHLIQNNYLIFLGIAYFFIGLIDLEHTLAYKGIGILPHNFNADHATKLWIGARFTESISLLIAPFFLRSRIKIGLVFPFFFLWTLLLLWAIHTDFFPACFIEGRGLTSFKKISEYVISILLAAGLIFLYLRRNFLNRKVFYLLAVSAIFTIASELAFTFYVSIFDISNLFGHYFKLISAYLIYLALIETGLKTPYSLLFHELKEKAELLETREKEFRAIFELSAVGMGKIDPISGCFTLVNRQLCRITGYEMDELLNKTIMEITHPEDRKLQQKIFSEYRQGESTAFEKRYIRKNGEIIWVRVTANSILSETGESLYSIGIVEDITKRRRDRELLRESEEKFRLIAQNIKDVIWLGTPNMNSINYINPAYEEIFGRSCQSLYLDPLSFWEAIYPEDSVPERGITDDETGEWNFCYRIIRPDGSIRWVEDSGWPIYNAEGEIVMMVGVARDITDRKLLEKQEKEQKKELEKEVSLRTAELAESIEKIRSLALQISEIEDRERRRIADYLHDDLQQLLVAANMHFGRLTAVLDQDQLDRSKVIGEILEEAIKASRSLSHDLSPPILYQGSLKDIFLWLVARMAKNYGLEVKLTMPEDLNLESDILRVFLYRSVQELLFNVVKHAQTGEADLTVHMDNDKLCIEVKDQGKGMIHQRSLTSPLSAKEVGMGIYSIRERLQLLGGSLAIESSPGEGSRFIIHLCLADINPKQLPGIDNQDIDKFNQAEFTPPTTLPNSKNGLIRIIIADDHEILRHGMTSLLKEESDLEIVGQANNGEEAIELTRELQPNLVIMDMVMPDMDGIEATEQITRKWPDVAVIANSMHEDQTLVDAAKRAGAVAYCTKTGSTAQLLATIRAVGHLREN